MPAVAASASRWGKVLAVIAEDAFALPHLVPLIGELRRLAASVVVAIRGSGRLEEIERLDVRTRPFDPHGGPLSVGVLRQVRDGLAALIDEERPDAVHAVAMQPMIMTSLALGRARHRPSLVVLHLTGQGRPGSSLALVAYLLRPLARSALRHCAARHATWVLAESSDDAGRMVADRVAVPERTAVVPGTGVDLALYPELPAPSHATVQVAFAGRMLRSEGPQVLMDAHRLLRARGVAIEVALHGGAGGGDASDAIPRETLSAWSAQAGVAWHGATGDILGPWRAADIAAVPALGGEGMPRAMLEAAACGRPLVVSDVPGCRQLVRPGVEGLVVTPGDPAALADALARLAADRAWRLEAGAAARRRLQHCSQDAVRTRVRDVYRMARESAAPAVEAQHGVAVAPA
jgi:glycosyltransferase involved in cell wall biosynthesis